jgi:hypothetical protein
MQILWANPSDAETLTEIAFAAKGHWGYPERWIESWSNQLTVTPELIASHDTHVAFVEDRAVGFYAIESRR